MTSPKSTQQLRLRVFAGPNGSGKSTVIDYVRKYKSKKRLIDFGHYINADDIASLLRKDGVGFSHYQITTTAKEYYDIAKDSGLINEGFPEEIFVKSYTLRKNILRLKDKLQDERLAQLTADFLRKKMLMERKRFSFETVFSHASKLDIMRQAAQAGYKVYLYFVSTESPEINKFRVIARKAKGGHDVPPDKIESRYYRSLGLLYDAAQLAYQAFFFDNSVNGEAFKMFAHFEKRAEHKKWDKIKEKDVPNWFRIYYSQKISPPQ